MDSQSLSGKFYNWDETKLWVKIKDLGKPEAEDIRSMLSICMPKIQTLLAQNGTAPTDFTLHDSQHAFRVAEQMVDLIPQDVFIQMSIYELAFLLLSAYLHDIGMCPEQNTIKVCHDYLLTETPKDNISEQFGDFQRWLDTLDEDITIPLSKGVPTSEIIRKSNLIIGYYCRACHVQWGDEWIEKYLCTYTFGTHVNWLDDLRSLCRSHHEGFGELLGMKFEPKMVGACGLIIHLRYLSVILRVADILDFDPERTPDVIYQHRDIVHNVG